MNKKYLVGFIAVLLSCGFATEAFSTYPVIKRDCVLPDGATFTVWAPTTDIITTEMAYLDTEDFEALCTRAKGLMIARDIYKSAWESAKGKLELCQQDQQEVGAQHDDICELTKSKACSDPLITEVYNLLDCPPIYCANVAPPNQMPIKSKSTKDRKAP